ncbi:cell division protein FtsB [Sinobacterium caligoides]|uniref:Cell division protein FtsB n=1 Tax=Sinobacterium caligoides TaxID=933926 RepID=A0A3N2DMI9_9GAMM|nr:septum formation initiator family protein [Sinobacterium caligoides]ROS01027.1 cell division protein FtsB [Sinobacterium caligoides]
MRVLYLVLAIVFVVLQFRLWVGPGSYAQVATLQHQIQLLEVKNLRDQERNRLMSAQIGDYRRGVDAIEEKARMELGMIKEGETFFWFVEPKSGER